jgi:hypothetical protein
MVAFTKLLKQWIADLLVHVPSLRDLNLGVLWPEEQAIRNEHFPVNVVGLVFVTCELPFWIRLMTRVATECAGKETFVLLSEIEILKG